MANTHGHIKGQKMISIETMTKDELINLHDKILDRLRYIDQMEARNKMTEFYFGDTVTFTTNDGRIIVGTVERFNQKSVSIKTDNGHRWRVAPQYLKKVPTSVFSTSYKTLES